MPITRARIVRGGLRRLRLAAEIIAAVRGKGRQGALPAWRQFAEMLWLKLRRRQTFRFYLMAHMWRREMPWRDKLDHFNYADFSRAVDTLNGLKGTDLFAEPQCGAEVDPSPFLVTFSQMGFPYRSWLIAPLAAATLLLAGCASREPLDYPHDWESSPGTVLPNGCPDLSGTYAVRATGAYPAQVESYPPLNEILGPGALRDAEERDRPWPTSPGATTATFTASGDWLYVRIRDAAKGESALKFKRKNWWGGATEGSDAMYQCLELELGPTLGFDGSRKRIVAIPYLFAEDDENFVFLSKARDGSLIVNYRTSRVFFTGVLIGSHARWVGSVWWRYPAVVSNQ